MACFAKPSIDVDDLFQKTEFIMGVLQSMDAPVPKDGMFDIESMPDRHYQHLVQLTHALAVKTEQV